ncbi:serine hydrolase [Caulobacter sp. CCNWLY153]|uniref:serine hydrolase domain-containing protein n=1 Tax=unclassified Caulobacter TaxID=2648921 RepID=UPI002FF17631
MSPRMSVGSMAAVLASLASLATAVAADGPSPDAIRWRLQHGREMQPTTGLLHSAAPSALAKGPSLDVEAIGFDYPVGARVNFNTYRQAMKLDGLIVLKDGKVVFERYYDGMKPHGVHNWASMSKSVVGVVALRLAAQDVIDLDAPVARYVPELAATPFGVASLQQNLDMRVSVSYPKALPPDRGLFAAAGLAPVPPGAPATIHEFLKAALPGAEPHGESFYYQNGSTEAVAWALEAASRKSLAELVNTYVWAPMGAADDGYYLVDRSRTAFAAGGIFSTLRDAARFGEFVCRGAGSDLSPRVTDWSKAPPSLSESFRYRDFWWRGRRGAFALGRYGQRIAIVPDKGLVIAQFAAYGDDRPRATSGQETAKAKAADLRDGEAFEALTMAIAERF